jgi:type III restriction enzyme
MELKDYQKYCINKVKVYLEHLAGFRAKYERILAIDPDMAGDFTRKAWDSFLRLVRCKLHDYFARPLI